MKEISINKVTPNDLEELQKISILTFSETFAPHNSEQNMSQYMSNSFSRHRLATELNNDSSEFYFARLGDRVIGYVKINTGASQTEPQTPNAVEIERIYVLQEYHGKKVGQLLYEQAIRIAHDRRSDYVWLGVWENNAKALRFYEKNGFVQFDKHTFKLGDDEQTDLMVKKTLT